MAAMSLRLHPLPFVNPNPIPPRRALLRRPLLPPLALTFPRLRSPFPYGLSPRRVLSFAAKENGGGEETEEELRGQSTMPDRFRYLTKEAPDRPIRWPWLIALPFLVYAWRTVLWELSNWKKAIIAIFHFMGYLFKLVLAFIYQFIGSPITGLIKCIEFSLFSIRSIYLNIVAFAPVPELTRIILFTSTVLAIAEAAVPDSVDSQPYLLMFAGLIGFGVIKGFIPEFLFCLLLPSMFCYSRFVKKRDNVSAVLPLAAVLTAVGEPWVRALTMVSYLTLAIVQYSRSPKESVTAEISSTGKRPPLPLLLAALAIGINIAAKWVRRRHLTWMIV
ncbi:hypothetical protein J5N97_016731 [Dioscorea zingiberensis]|uniref:Uncharacterized protein n=1 Tax=Dioscorea zingiberensis TaxID=325984 RepID=A0A9D5CJX7_9LILI|nr:hypothetical protein J5N97_016731 [Dioscorea zingiberensis]